MQTRRPLGFAPRVLRARAAGGAYIAPRKRNQVLRSRNRRIAGARSVVRFQHRAGAARRLNVTLGGVAHDPREPVVAVVCQGARVLVPAPAIVKMAGAGTCNPRAGQMKGERGTHTVEKEPNCYVICATG